MLCHEASELESRRRDGALAPHEETALGQHLAGCAKCCEQAEAFARLDALLTSAHCAVPAPQFPQRVMVRVQRHRRRETAVRAVLLVCSASVAALILMVLPLLSPASPAGALIARPTSISALAGVLARIGELAKSLLGAGGALRQAILGSPAWLLIVALLCVAVLVSVVWLRAVQRASLTLGRRTV